MNSFNIGIIGPGRVAHRFAAACSKLTNVKLHSVYSKDILSATKFSKCYQQQKRIYPFDDINEFLSDPRLHGVIISTPDPHHFEYAMLAAKYSKHLLIEKPICTDIEDAKTLIKEIKKANITCCVGYHLRWHDGFRKLANYIHQEFTGELYHMDIHWEHEFIQEAKWRKSHSTSKWWSLTTLGTHLIDIVRWYFTPLCGEVIESKVVTTNQKYNGTDETSIVSLKFKSGATASIYSTILHHSSLSLKIYTSKGIISGDNLVGPFDKRNITILDKRLLLEFNNDLYEKELIDFYLSANLKKQPEVTAIEGLYNIQCMLGF